MQDCSNSSALTMELLQPCTKPSEYLKYGLTTYHLLVWGIALTFISHNLQNMPRCQTGHTCAWCPHLQREMEISPCQSYTCDTVWNVLLYGLPCLWKGLRMKRSISGEGGLKDISLRNGLLARYVKLRVAHAPGMPGTFSPPPRVSDSDRHHGTCVTHVP